MLGALVLFLARLGRQIVFLDLFGRDGNSVEVQFDIGIEVSAKFSFDAMVDQDASRIVVADVNDLCRHRSRRKIDLLGSLIGQGDRGEATGRVEADGEFSAIVFDDSGDRSALAPYLYIVAGLPPEIGAIQAGNLPKEVLVPVVGVDVMPALALSRGTSNKELEQGRFPE